MKAILDTHTFLWWNLADPRLSPTAREFISAGENEIFLSAASAWEIAIKTGRGRLILPEPPERYVANRMLLHHLQPLPIQLSHALHVFNLPNLHQDPFDRLLIAQSQLENLPLLSADPEIARYDVNVIW
jgi:PIN domain nuclease of toxin-antitoxin system